VIIIRFLAVVLKDLHVPTSVYLLVTITIASLNSKLQVSAHLENQLGYLGRREKSWLKNTSQNWLFKKPVIEKNLIWKKWNRMQLSDLRAR
jgi:hypothetical protein